jgi:hypothetical protein
VVQHLVLIRTSAAGLAPARSAHPARAPAGVFAWQAGVSIGDRDVLEVTAMPERNSPGPSVKKPDTYEALRDKGMSKERAAKISNAQAGKQKAKRKKSKG